MTIQLNDTTITGISAGGLPAGVITRTEIGFPGNILQTVTVQSRTQASYSVPVIAAGTGLTNAGTEIALVTMSITPQKAGNKIIIKWMLNAECTDNNMNYVITRNGSVMSGAADAGRWSGIGHNQYDANYSSTPLIDSILFVDDSCLAGVNTYRIHVKSSGGTARTYYLNRTVGSAGADNNETGVSNGILYEVSV